MKDLEDSLFLPLRRSKMLVFLVGSLYSVSHGRPKNIPAPIWRNAMSKEHASRLKRSLYPMPDFVQDALLKRGLLEAYQKRPAYQRNDYLGWITRAKQPATREKRLQHMLDELATADRYMKMAYPAKEPPSSFSDG